MQCVPHVEVACWKRREKIFKSNEIKYSWSCYTFATTATTTTTNGTPCMCKYVNIFGSGYGHVEPESCTQQRFQLQGLVVAAGVWWLGSVDWLSELYDLFTVRRVAWVTAGVGMWCVTTTIQRTTTTGVHKTITNTMHMYIDNNNKLLQWCTTNL